MEKTMEISLRNHAMRDQHKKETTGNKSVSVTGLDSEDIKIILAQKEIKALGYQWQEHIYNDGISECSVDFAKGTDPCTFMDGKDDFGWGRLSRAQCWEQALDRIRRTEGV